MIQDNYSNITSDIDTSNFSIEMNSSMFTLLTKNVYNNIILAPIREWSCNAIDACIEAGTPISYDVNVPTLSDPTFSVRDYGTGLSEEDITGLFSILGASTKRNSNKYNGTFGIGRMAGLAYATSFTVVSYYNNVEYTYLISIKDGIPANVKLSEHPTSEPNGLKLSLSVDINDISKFQDEMTFFYRFTDHKPNLSKSLDIDMSKYTILSGKDWYVFNGATPNSGSSTAYLLMANVPYKLSTYTYNIPSNCVIKVPTGSVTFTPGRESLTYDEKTRAAVDKAVDQMKTDVVSKVNIDIAAASTPIEKAKVANRYLKNFPNLIAAENLIVDSNFKLAWRQFILKGNISSHFKLADFNGSSTTVIRGGVAINDSQLFVIQDIASNFVKAFNSIGISSYHMIIVKPVSNTLSEIENMLPHAKTWLNNLGIPKDKIVYASDYVSKATSTKSTSSSLASSEFNFSYFSTANECITVHKGGYIDLTSNQNKYLYFEMNGSSPLADQSLIRATLQLAEITSTEYKIIGVPKKVIKKVRADPNFTLANEYFNKLVPSLPTYTAYSDKAYKFGYTYISANYLNNHEYPQDIKDAADLCKKYTDSGSTKSAYSLESIMVHYPIKVDKLTDTSLFDAIPKKYPLLDFINNTYTNRSERLAHYLKLEKFYADHSSN